MLLRTFSSRSKTGQRKKRTRQTRSPATPTLILARTLLHDFDAAPVPFFVHLRRSDVVPSVALVA